MPRYFFNTRDGHRERDTEGTELKDDASARKHAIVYAGDVLSDEPDILWDGEKFVVEVCDSAGKIIITVTSCAMDVTSEDDEK